MLKMIVTMFTTQYGHYTPETVTPAGRYHCSRQGSWAQRLNQPSLWLVSGLAPELVPLVTRLHCHWHFSVLNHDAIYISESSPISIHILRVGITAGYKNTRSVAPLSALRSVPPLRSSVWLHSVHWVTMFATPHTLPWRGASHRFKMLTTSMRN